MRGVENRQRQRVKEIFEGFDFYIFLKGRVGVFGLYFGRIFLFIVWGMQGRVVRWKWVDRVRGRFGLGMRWDGGFIGDGCVRQGEGGVKGDLGFGLGNWRMTDFLLR